MYDFEKDVPYFMPCLYPQIAASLKHNDIGINSAILANSDLLSVINFSIEKNDIPSVNVKSTRLLCKNLIEKYLELEVSFVELKDTELDEYVKMKIKKNEMVVIGGSCYHLPHSFDYHNPNYIRELNEGGRFGLTNHWLSILNENESKYLVYDPIPTKFYGYVDKNHILNFFEGDLIHLKNLDNLPRNTLLSKGVCEIKSRKKVSDMELGNLPIKMLNDLIQINREKKVISDKNKITYFGIHAFEQMIEHFILFYNSIDDFDMLKKYSKCFFEMKFTFLFLKLLLIEVKNISNDISVGRKINAVENIVDNFQSIFRLLEIQINRRQNQIFESEINENVDQIRESLIILFE